MITNSTDGVRTRACLRINDLKSFPLDRSGTVPFKSPILGYTFHKNNYSLHTYQCYLIFIYFHCYFLLIII